jgi:hypothetical protein
VVLREEIAEVLESSWRRNKAHDQAIANLTQTNARAIDIEGADQPSRSIHPHGNLPIGKGCRVECEDVARTEAAAFEYDGRANEVRIRTRVHRANPQVD